MDSPDVTAITKIVKMVGTEFKSASDEDVSFWIGLQAPVISKKKFGADYNLAVALLVCHAMKMAGNGDSSLGTISNTGRLASVSEGGVSISQGDEQQRKNLSEAEAGLHQRNGDRKYQHKVCPRGNVEEEHRRKPKKHIFGLCEIL